VRAGDDPAVGLGEEDAERAPLGRELVAVAAGDAHEEALAAQAAQVVGELARAVAGKEPGDEGMEAAVGDPLEQVREAAERREERHHAGVAEAKRGGRLALIVARGQDDAFERGGVGRALAGSELRVEETVVRLEADADERLPVFLGDAPADPEVARVVDGRLGPERPALLEVLLHLRGAVVDLDRRLNAAVHDAGAEQTGGLGADAAAEDDGDVVGTAERELVTIVRSNHSLPACGRSKTRVSESSSWRKASW